MATLECGVAVVDIYRLFIIVVNNLLHGYVSMLSCIVGLVTAFDVSHMDYHLQ